MLKAAQVAAVVPPEAAQGSVPQPYMGEDTPGLDSTMRASHRQPLAAVQGAAAVWVMHWRAEAWVVQPVAALLGYWLGPQERQAERPGVE